MSEPESVDDPTPPPRRRRPTRVEIIPPDGGLQRKAIHPTRGMLLQPTPEDLKRLEQAIANSTDRVISTVGGKLKELRALALKGPTNSQEIGEFVERISTESFDIKGLGGTFSFPLLTAIAKSLNDFVKGRETLNATQIAIIRFHIDALYVVLANRIRGEGGDTEAALLHAFKQASARFR